MPRGESPPGRPRRPANVTIGQEPTWSDASVDYGEDVVGGTEEDQVRSSHNRFKRDLINREDFLKKEIKKVQDALALLEEKPDALKIYDILRDAI